MSDWQNTDGKLSKAGTLFMPFDAAGEIETGHESITRCTAKL